MDDRTEEAKQTSALSDLIEVERRVLASIRDAEAEADQAIAAAKAELESRTHEGDAELEAELSQLRARLERERTHALALIERDTDSAVARHLDIEDARVRALGAYLAQRVAEDDLEPDPSGASDLAPPDADVDATSP